MSAGKVMTIIFCNIQDEILNHFVPPKPTVTGNYHTNVIKTELSSAIKSNWPQLQISEILQRHDNAPSHSSGVVFNIVKELDIELLPRPPYSPYLGISDFWLFPNLKNRLHGQK